MQKVRKNTIRVLFVALIAAVCFSLGLFAACGSNGGNGNGGNGGSGTGGGDKPSGEHTHTFVETVIEPTCTEKGYTIHKCACGYEYKDYETAALGHLFGNWRVTTPETADRDGEEKRICTRENCDYFETRKIPKLDHTHEYTETVVEPTCTEKGYTLHKCECGDEYKDNETEALGHLFGEWETITPATEDSEGLEQRVCARKNCGFKEERKIPVLSHTHHYITTIVEPTCTERGYTKYTCEKCGNSYNADYEKALGHNFGERKEIKPATEEEDGLKERTCARCGETEEQAIPAKTHEHKFVDTVIEPTCTEKGYTIHKCKCGEQYEDSYVSALDHSFTNYLSDGNATCTKDGTKTAKCDRCDETKTIADEGSAKGHKPSDYISNKEPTCTEKGSKHKECTVCGETLETVEVPAKGHDYSTEWTVDKEATCSETGIKSHHCTRCDAKTDETEIPLAAHTFDDEICTVCGAVELIEATGLEYTLSEDKTYYIVSEMGDCTRKHFIIPATYNGLPVKEIGEAAFYKKSDIIQVVLPDSIEKIGNSAFYQCPALKEITFGENLLTIGDSAFYDCDGIKKIVIPDSVTSIGNSAFSYCSSLKVVTIGNGTKSIGDYAFQCTELTSITIPDSVIYVGDCAFRECDSITSVTMGKAVTSIGESAFRYCDLLTNIIIPDSVTSIGEDAFYHCSSLDNVTIGKGVKSIGKGAFNYCVKVTKTIKGVGYVDKWVVSCDKTVTNVELKADTVGIADSAFYQCGSLTSVTIGNGVTSIGDEAFWCCSSLTSITIPDSVTSIGCWAFDVCNSLKGVYITDIEAWCNIAFGNEYGNPLLYARNLYLNNELVTDLVIPDSVTSIGNYAFDNCSLLTSITIPDSVTSIGEEAFSYCISLTRVTIGNGVTSIGENAFDNCKSLTGVYITDITTWCNIEFDNYASNPLCYAHKLYLDNELVTDLVIRDGVTSIGDYVFSRCTSLTSVTIGKSVASIGYAAFDGCSNLTDINCSGSMEEWNKIVKAESWDYQTGNYVVHCTDGDIKKS